MLRAGISAMNRRSHAPRVRHLGHSVRWFDAHFASTDLYALRLAHHRLVQVATQNYPHFSRICCLLVANSHEFKVRQRALSILYRYGHRDDLEAEAQALAACQIPRLRPSGLIALTTVGSAHCVPLVRAAALENERYGLVAYAAQARTARDEEEALRLARERLFSHEHSVQHDALRALNLLSTAEREEELLIAAYERYPCEYIAHALGGGSVSVLPYLYRKQEEIGPGYAEYKDLQDAITRLLMRIHTGIDPDTQEEYP
jgi:hypothetical protein